MALVVGLVGVAVSISLLPADTDRALWMIIGMSLCLPSLLLPTALPTMDLLRMTPRTASFRGPELVPKGRMT
jgi:hypothetical protein